MSEELERKDPGETRGPLRCRCPVNLFVGGLGSCRYPVTQEDMLCDRCRAMHGPKTAEGELWAAVYGQPKE